MKKKYTLFPILLFVNVSCMPVFHLSKSYTSPEYHGILIDSTSSPVAGAKVNFYWDWNKDKKAVKISDVNGKVYLDAQKRFIFLEIIVMDPGVFANTLLVRTKSTSEGDSLIRHYIRYASRRKTIVYDTINISQNEKPRRI